MPYVAKGAVFNSAATANTAVFGGLTMRTSEVAATYRLTVGIKPGETASVLNVSVTVGGTKILFGMQASAALVVGDLYMWEFDLPQAIGADAASVDIEGETTTVLGIATLVELDVR